MFHVLDAQMIQVLNLIVVVLIPTLVALVTKFDANPAVKSLTMLVLAAATTILTSILDAGGWTAYGTLMLLVENIITAVSFYYGVAKPVGLAGENSRPARLTGGIG